MLPHYLVQTLTYGQKRSNYNDKLQGIVATYLRCGGVVNNLIKKGSLQSLSEKKN